MYYKIKIGKEKKEKKKKWHTHFLFDQFVKMLLG